MDWVVSVVFLLGVNSTTTGVVLIRMLKWFVLFTMVHHPTMVHTVLIRVSHLLVPFQLKICLVLHWFRVHLCLVLLIVIPMLGALFYPHHQHWGFSSGARSLVYVEAVSSSLGWSSAAEESGCDFCTNYFTTCLASSG